MVLACPTGPYSLLRLTSSTGDGKAAAAGCRSRGGHNCLNPDPERSQVGRLSVRCLIKFRPLLSPLARLWAEVGTILRVLRRRRRGGSAECNPPWGKECCPGHRCWLTTHLTMDMDKAVLSPPIQVQQKGPSSVYSPFANAALFRVVHI